MKIDIKNICAMAILGLATAGTPTLAQQQLENNQPVRGELHNRAADLQTRFDTAYKSGKIDATELANFKRDLDGILVKESDYKSRHDGLTASGHETLDKQLDVLEARLDRHADKTGLVTNRDAVTSTDAARAEAAREEVTR